MRNRPLPDLAFLRECFDLRDDGTLLWRVRPIEHFMTSTSWKQWCTKYAGTEAGCISDGYPTLTLLGRTIRVHRVAYYISTGVDPLDHEVDHRDLNTLNNSPSNLRLASRSENATNVGTFSTNSSGVKGVCWNVRRSRWVASIMKNGKRHLRSFVTKGAAAEWVAIKRATLHGQFARHK